MVPIKPIGSCIYTDETGYLRSDFDVNKLQKEWLLVVEKFKTNLISQKKDLIESVFLRGSVATGNAVKDISDIDFLVVTNKNLNLLEREEINKIANSINIKFPFVTRFDIGFYTHKQIIESKEKVLVKLRSFCIYGNDLTNEITNLKPGTDVAVTLLGFENELNKIKLEIKTGFYTPENTQATCKWFMKRLLRSGLELVSIKESCYTRDLYKCWEVFSKHYQLHKDEMYRVLHLAINPTNNIDDITQFFTLGEFLLKEAEKANIIKKLHP